MPTNLRNLLPVLSEISEDIDQDWSLEAVANSEASVLDIALNAGFASHEVFTRAFARHFGCAPKTFRSRSTLLPDQRHRYREIVRAVSPCVRLYRISLAKHPEKTTMPASPVERRVLEDEQPILYIQRRIPVSQLQPVMGECFGILYGHGQQSRLAPGSGLST